MRRSLACAVEFCVPVQLLFVHQRLTVCAADHWRGLLNSLEICFAEVESRNLCMLKQLYQPTADNQLLWLCSESDIRGHLKRSEQIYNGHTCLCRLHAAAAQDLRSLVCGPN